MKRELSSESREKMRLKALGNKRSLGRKVSLKTRRLISAANRGRVCPPEHKIAMSKARTGVPLRPEVLSKMRLIKSKVLKCPHCGKVGKAGGMQKHHMKNCKEKKSCRLNQENQNQPSAIM